MSEQTSAAPIEAAEPTPEQAEEFAKLGEANATMRKWYQRKGEIAPLNAKARERLLRLIKGAARATASGNAMEAAITVGELLGFATEHAVTMTSEERAAEAILFAERRRHEEA